jgi:hypothetical protein
LDHQEQSEKKLRGSMENLQAAQEAQKRALENYSLSIEALETAKNYESGSAHTHNDIEKFINAAVLAHKNLVDADINLNICERDAEGASLLCNETTAHSLHLLQIQENKRISTILRVKALKYHSHYFRL